MIFRNNSLINFTSAARSFYLAVPEKSVVYLVKQ